MSRKQYVDFIETTGLKHIKQNVRPWGSYELAISYDGQRWFTDREVFGWGFSTHDAIIATFEKYVNQPEMDGRFYGLMGQEKLDRLITLVKNPEPETEELPAEPLKLLPSGQ